MHIFTTRIWLNKLLPTVQVWPASVWSMIKDYTFKVSKLSENKPANKQKTHQRPYAVPQILKYLLSDPLKKKCANF